MGIEQSDPLPGQQPHLGTDVAGLVCLGRVDSRGLVGWAEARTWRAWPITPACITALRSIIASDVRRQGGKTRPFTCHLVVPANSTAPATSSKMTRLDFQHSAGRSMHTTGMIPKFYSGGGGGSSAPGGKGRSLSSRARDVAGIPTHWSSPLVKKKRKKKGLGCFPFSLQSYQAFKEEGLSCFQSQYTLTDGRYTFLLA